MIALMSKCFATDTLYMQDQMCQFMLDNGSTLQVYNEVYREMQYEPATKYACYNAQKAPCDAQTLQCVFHSLNTCYELQTQYLFEYHKIAAEKYLKVLLTFFIDGQQTKHIQSVVQPDVWQEIDGVKIKIVNIEQEQFAAKLFQFQNVFNTAWNQTDLPNQRSFEQSVCESNITQTQLCYLKAEQIRNLKQAQDGFAIVGQEHCIVQLIL